ncbi:MAG TPA: rhodanese-like domain-containing protein [Stellaceae bacterium]|nr:rhodanese-like domain-containing protein [Stellaceae bacterium]
MRDSKALISTAQLAAELGRADLRVYDCTTYLAPAPPGSDDPYLPVPGSKSFEEAHVPGADFLDLQGEFSDAATRLRFMMPTAAALERAFARHGIGQGTRVVLYSIGTMMWATRFWWMLKSLGFDEAAVLDGGFDNGGLRVVPPRADPPRVIPLPSSRPHRGRASSSTRKRSSRRSIAGMSSWSMRLARNSTAVAIPAATAGQGGSRAASMSRPRRS